MVERPLSMRKVRGSMPLSSTFSFFLRAFSWFFFLFLCRFFLLFSFSLIIILSLLCVSSPNTTEMWGILSKAANGMRQALEIDDNFESGFPSEDIDDKLDSNEDNKESIFYGDDGIHFRLLN